MCLTNPVGGWCYRPVRELTALAVLLACTPPGRAALPLLPQPQQIETLGGEFSLGPSTRVAVFPPEDADLRFAAELLTEELGCKPAGRKHTPEACTHGEIWTDVKNLTALGSPPYDSGRCPPIGHQ